MAYTPPYATQAELAQLAASLWGYVANESLNVTKLGELLMSTQADVDALTAQVEAQDAKVQDAVTNINAEIAALQAQQVDTSGLEAAVAALGGDVDTVDAIAPPPAPPAS